MSERKCRRRQPVQAVILAQSEPAPMEAPEIPMNRYISPRAPSSCCVSSCESACLAQETRVLLEQLVELSVTQNQLLVDLLGATNALTAAVLTTRSAERPGAGG